MSVVLSSLCACSLIDDDMTGCANTRTLDCRIHFYENIDSQLTSQITGSGEQAVVKSLSSYFNSLLVPSSHDVEMSFFDVETSELCSKENRILYGSEGTFSIELPQRDLRCVATSQNPLYAGRQVMPQGKDKYQLDLYPCDAQVALIARVDSSIKDVQVEVVGCASSFNASDSTYSYSDSTVISMPYRTEASVGIYHTYTSSVLPSSDSRPWQVIILATTATGSITRNVLTVNRRLNSGEIRIIQVAIGSDGAARTSDAGVGASVTLDWKKGGQYNPEI